MFGEGSRKLTFARAVWALIGHFAGSGVLFISFYTIGWLISVVVNWLNSIHPLPTAIMDVVMKVELGFMYFDALLCAIVLTAGAIRFIKDLGKLR